ncbi:MAG TPA: DUF3300 domain-containing protein [Terriglobales bacterium]|jgi:uncharacterized membrane protein YgcG|nr:DUF3300 domain-containing protein [Terriglobales bacterium]
MRTSILKVLRQAATLFLVCALPAATLPAGASPGPQGPGPSTAPASDTQAATIPPDQLDSLVAPIALYPDPLLAQVLAASTYPLEIVQLQQWMDQNKGLTGKALTDAVMQQNWDPSVQAMAVLPDVVKLLAGNIKWTTDLGNAFLAQENDVMNAVQRMRLKAQGKGQLKTTQQQTVETQVVESKTVVVIEPSSPDVVYVPSYDPMVVYGEPAYAYPPMYYPPGYAVAGAAISFGVGMAIGAAWGGGGWGWNCGWGGNNNININNNNNFINNSNRQNVSNRPGSGGSGTQWQHNPQHRGGTPYGDRGTATKYGGTTRGDSMANRQATARQNVGQMGGQGQFGNRQQGGFQGGAGNFGGAGGGDRVGGRDVSRGSGSGAFGGASSGMSGRDARASQSRGASSMGSRGSSGRSSGGFSGGGGGRRGGGGGGRRR